MAVGGVIVRLEVDRMRHQVLHAFHDHEAELEQIVSEELDKALANFDFANAVRKTVWQVLPDLIDTAVQDALRAAVTRGSMRDLIDQAVRTAAAKLVDET